MPDEHVEREWESVNEKSRVGLIIVGIAALVFLIFMLSNTASADIQFFGWQVDMPEWLLFTILFILGVIVGWVGSSLRRRSKIKAARD